MKLEDVEKLTSSDINQLSYKDLKKVARIYFDVANKRIKRLEKSKKGDTPALRNLKKQQGISTPHFGIKSTSNRNQLLKSVIQAKEFLGSKTSTLTGIKKIEKKFFIDELGGEKIPENTSDFWEDYRRFRELNPHLVSNLYDSKNAITKFFEVYKPGTYIDNEEIEDYVLEQREDTNLSDIFTELD